MVAGLSQDEAAFTLYKSFITLGVTYPQRGVVTPFFWRFTMFITANQIHAAMAAIVEAPGYPLLQAYKQDFYEYDLETLQQGWNVQSRAIWVVTPNGTHLNFVGQHERQVEEVSASVSCGYSQLDIFLLQPKGIKRITRSQAIDEAKRLEYKVKAGGHITDALGNTIAYMSVHRMSDPRFQCTQVHFEPGLAYTASPSQLAALRSIALHESIAMVQTLFVRVQRVTVGDALLTATGLVQVPRQDDDFNKSVIFCEQQFNEDGKGFHDKRRGWTTLALATVLDTPSARIALPQGQSMLTLREARLRVALHQSMAAC